MLEGRLIHRTEAHLGSRTQRNVSLRRGAQKIFVASRRYIEAESGKILGCKGGVAHFGVYGLRKSFREGQAESERCELIQIDDGAPSVGQKRVEAQMSFVAA